MSPLVETLERELRRRLLVLGAGGAALGDAPEVVTAAQRALLEAGADIILTNTFRSDCRGRPVERVGGNVAELYGAAARIARSAATECNRRDSTRARFVAGVVDLAGESGDGHDPAPDDRHIATAVPSLRALDRLQAVGREQAAALVAGGVDILCVSGTGDVPQARAVLSAIRELLEEHGEAIPLWIWAASADGADDRAGRLPSGQSLPAFYTGLRCSGLACVGLAAAAVTDGLTAGLTDLSATADAYVALRAEVCSPADGRGPSAADARGPAACAAALRQVAQRGFLNAVGAGPGATPQHLAAIARAVDGLPARSRPSQAAGCWLSGREPLLIRPGIPFVKIGERTNVAGSARFARLMRDGRHAAALAVARQQVEQGAQIIDVNMDHPLLDPARAMIAFIEQLAADPVAGRVPLMIDSADWAVLAVGLRCLPGRGIINSINLQEGEEEFRRRAQLIAHHGAVPLVLAIDGDGPATSRERKLRVCTRAFRLLTEEIGLAPHDVILDPGLLAIGTGLPEHADYAIAYIEACRELKETLPDCLISGGVSNLSFAFRGNDTVRAAMHAVFLQHAIPAGMDMGIVNPAQLPSPADLPDELREAAADVVLNRRPDAAIRLARLARRTGTGGGI